MKFAFFQQFSNKITFNVPKTKCLKIKKGKGFCLVFLLYGRFLVTSNARTAPITTTMMAIATIPYSTVVFDAKPLVGDDVGADVAVGGFA